MSTGIERPIELAPEVHRELLGKRHGTLRLPMRPQPVLTDAQWELINGELMGLGYLCEWTSRGAWLLDAAMQEGLLPDLRCPYGREGDLLWCREPFAQHGQGFSYLGHDAKIKIGRGSWIPAHRMPRAAARLVLKIDCVQIGEDEGGALVWEIDVERVSV